MACVCFFKITKKDYVFFDKYRKTTDILRIFDTY